MSYYEKIEESLNKICLECNFYETSECIKSKCNIGFAINSVKAAKKNGLQIINDGFKLIPKNDIKVYNKDLIARSISSICIFYKECKHEHHENSIISLARKSLESTYLKDDVNYPENILMYIINVAKQDQQLADKIKAEYDEILKKPKEKIIMDKTSIAKKHPILVELKENETYLWCTCGKSSNAPFCNGAHVGTSFIPLTFTAKKNKKAYLCACNHTKNPPFCDGSHLKLQI